MSPPLVAALVVAVAYLSGSVPYGYLIARRRGIDIQAEGSGNIGATNVTRILGKKTGVAVLLLDVLKGALPVAVALALAAAGDAARWAVAASALAAVVGHCFPVWLRFHGGKGVATSLGVFLVLDLRASGLAIVVFAVVYAASRVASLGSLAAALLFPAFLWLLGHAPVDVALAAAMALVITIRHRDNIARLREGRENRV